MAMTLQVNCAVAGCPKPRRTRDWCGQHYELWLKYGDPLKRQRIERGSCQRLIVESLKTRDRSEGCWEWPYGKDGNGYAETQFEGRACKACIAALILDGKPRPEPPNNHALHSCDNRGCFNPSHLRWGSDWDNKQDMKRRNRAARGATLSHLTESQVMAIRADQRTHAVIAADFKVSGATVSRLKTRVTWAHI